MNEASYLPVTWAKPPTAKIHAFTTLVQGGVSQGEFAAFNLATHVGDNQKAVLQNRTKLCDEMRLPAEPVWLDQVHSNRVIDATEFSGTDLLDGQLVKADASYTNKTGVVCAVLTADCLPVFFCNAQGTEVAVAHAGWRGLHAGIISETVKSMASSVADIMVYFGPAIGPASFEVGLDVYQAFLDKHEMNKLAFEATDSRHYNCDIYNLAKMELQALGVQHISGGGLCTFTDQRFFSFRRHTPTGRMASLTWMA